MERIAIILRKSEAPNRFREIILGCFSSDAFDQHLICSGFFQERGKYSASNCFALSAPRHVCFKEITVVGMYSGIWSVDFDSFTKSLRGILCGGLTPLIVHKRKLRRYRWHAKVFVTTKNGKPVLGIIGSSNMTVRAFGNRKSWNYEADVVMWDDSDSEASRIVRGALEIDGRDQEGFDIVVSDYAINDRLNRGLTMQQKLGQLAEEIKSISEAIE